MFLKHQPWHPPEHADSAWFEVEWNCWRTRQHPYSALEGVDRIVTVSGGGPRQGRVMNESTITRLIQGPYASHQEAWSMLSAGVDADILRHAGVTRRNFLEHPYTRSAPSEGWLVAFTTYPELIFDQPRPASLRFRPNGWAEMDDDDLSYLYEGATVVDDETPIWIPR